MSITVKDVSKRFGKFTALDRVSVEVPDGCLVALLGPSGSGKTTLLRIIAGLEVPDGGTVHYHDEEVTHHSARDRNVGFVFQHYALFRHMNVFENIAFALRVRRWPQPKVQQRVHELLHLIRLEGLERRMPSELSGGQRQRVALARALAAAPRVLLLDEPFGALDAKVRQELRQWLRQLHDDIGATTIFVTHDQEEAFAVADKVVVMCSGGVEQTGTPQEVFDHPANAFVMDFLGNVNIFHGRVFGNGRLKVADCRINGESIPSALGNGASDLPPEAQVYVRPHELDITHEPGGAPGLRAKVLHVNPAGSVTRVELLALDFDIVVHVELSLGRSEELGLRAGETVYVSPRRVRVFVPEYSI
jgi:sulfate/thiosulfate transport system ATP-binding protein